MKKAMADFDYTGTLREALRKTSAEMTASAKAMTALGRGLLSTWSFGTVVQAKASALGHLAMVIKDEGGEFFAGMILGDSASIPAGTVIQKLNRRNWRPVED